MILQEIYELCWDTLLQIRTSDLSKRPYNIEGEEKYAELTTKISSKLGRCTQDSLRKNIFVDLHRMGLIDRFNAKKKQLNPFDNGTKKYIALTDFGIEFLQSTDIFTHNLLFTRALENLMQGFGEEILHIILELESNYLTLYEVLFFVTFLYQKLDSKTYNRSDIISLIRDYRTLSKFQKQALLEKVKDYCEPKNFSGDKTQKRDFHNFLNETQQILSLLTQMAYFEYNKNDSKLYIRTGTYGIYEDNTKLKRSIKEKDLYFEKHNITKEKGFELHHIVPLCLAASRAEFQIIDKWENMVYIDAFSHAKITQNNNANMRLSFENNNANFSDFNDCVVHCENNINIKYDTEKQELMLDYNKRILDSKV
ncbi:restriction endonuclease subunit R [Helicobacter cinaedi]|uniref:restriction endonuclease subunit R n=1 Tax=Helicobacter cinaedi TaxID=213 RepID=UPI001FB3AAC5|nr:restriction endonuclease subunit R [Helicobacter cinaedi]